MNKKNAAKVGTLYMFASFFNKGIAFLTIPLFTRILSTAEYGIVTTYSSYASILTAIIGMQLNVAIRMSRGLDCKVKIDESKEVSTIFTFTLLVALFLMSISLACVCFLHIDVNITLLILCFLEGLFTALITDYTYYQMMEYKYIGRTLLMILPNLLAAIVSVVLIYVMTTNKYMGRIIGLSGMHIIIGLIVCACVFVKARPQIDAAYLKWALKVSTPLIIHGIALNILSQADRTMITAFRDSSETGIYSLIYSYSMIATVVTTGLEGIWVPWFTEKMNTKKYSDIDKSAGYYVNIMAIAIIGILMVSPELIKFLSPSTYWVGFNIVPPLVMSNYIIFAYTMYVNVEYYYEKTGFITVNTVIAAITNIILNAVFIPKYGYVAAAYTTLTSYVLSFVLHMRYAKKINDSILPFKIFFYPMIQLVIGTIIFVIFMDNLIVRWSCLLVYIIIIGLANRSLIIGFLKTQKR